MKVQAVNWELYTPDADLHYCVECLRDSHLVFLQTSVRNTISGLIGGCDDTQFIWSQKRKWQGYTDALKLLSNIITTECYARYLDVPDDDLYDVSDIHATMPWWWGVREYHISQQWQMCAKDDYYESVFCLKTRGIHGPPVLWPDNVMRVFYRDAPDSGIEYKVEDSSQQ